MNDLDEGVKEIMATVYNTRSLTGTYSVGNVYIIKDNLWYGELKELC